MKAADRCIYEEEITVEKAIEIRDRDISKEKPKFTCIGCGERVRAHKDGGENSEAHFEHLEENYSCEYSAGN